MDDSKNDLVAEYAAGQDEMRRFRRGDVLIGGARDLLMKLPAGQLLLVATSVEGLALAAVCAALRGGETEWRRIDLGSPSPAVTNATVVVVEPIDGGVGWRSAVESHYPGARFLFPSVARALAA